MSEQYPTREMTECLDGDEAGIWGPFHKWWESPDDPEWPDTDDEGGQ
jgi:hypothetical protein